MFNHPDPEVLVVGAGPVGLVAALFLEQYGVGVKIVDTHHRTTQHSYALVIFACMPASGDELEPLLQQIGLTAASSERGAGLGPPPPRGRASLELQRMSNTD